MIKTSKKHSFFVFVFVFVSLFHLNAQEVEETDDYTEQVRGLVNFYRYMLNTVGAENTSTRDKEVIITESYKKIFKNANVQIEDDLLPDRNAISNKNVSAYLRDVDFFFKDISFEFNDLEITKSERENGEDFYLVTFTNVINATTIESEPYNNSMKRYIEVNVQEEEDDLKIASVYSTKLSREKELRNWWEGLTYEWTRIFSEYVDVESVSDKDLMKIASIDSLNLSGNRYIQDIKPLSALINLKYLNISDTRVSNLEPIRFALRLETLIASNTPIEKVDLLQYFEKLKVLDLNNSTVNDISAISRAKSLEEVNLSSTAVVLFDAFQELEKLRKVNLSNTSFSHPGLLIGSKKIEYLDLSRTGVYNIDYIAELPKLTFLDLSETYIISLKALKGLNELKTLRVNQTQVSSLEPIAELDNLERVYADNTGITEKKALEFMSRHRDILVLTNTEMVMEWWKGLDPDWKRVLSNVMKNPKPEKEDVLRLVNIDSLDISNERLLQSAPLAKFRKLEHLNISNNLFTSLGFATSLDFLELLFAENVPVESTEGLHESKNLRAISLKGSLVEDISGLYNLNRIEILDLDNTPIKEEDVVEFLNINPRVTVLYQSEQLLEWWSELLPEWKVVFGLSENPSGLELHKLIESTEIAIENAPIVSLKPLDQFIRLRKVFISNTRVTSLRDLSEHKQIEEITCKNGPLMDVEGLVNLKNLKLLDISNTAVEDLRPLAPLKSLETLNASGTNIRKLKGVSELINLKKLDVSNTRVWQLDRLYDIRDLETLICYNTRIRARKIEELKQEFPDCEVTYY